MPSRSSSDEEEDDDEQSSSSSSESEESADSSSADSTDSADSSSSSDDDDDDDDEKDDKPRKRKPVKSQARARPKKRRKSTGKAAKPKRAGKSKEKKSSKKKKEDEDENLGLYVFDEKEERWRKAHDLFSAPNDDSGRIIARVKGVPGPPRVYLEGRYCWLKMGLNVLIRTKISQSTLAPAWWRAKLIKRPDREKKPELVSIMYRNNQGKHAQYDVRVLNLITDEWRPMFVGDRFEGDTYDSEDISSDEAAPPKKVARQKRSSRSQGAAKKAAPKKAIKKKKSLGVGSRLMILIEGAYYPGVVVKKTNHRPPLCKVRFCGQNLKAKLYEFYDNKASASQWIPWMPLVAGSRLELNVKATQKSKPKWLPATVRSVVAGFADDVDDAQAEVYNVVYDSDPSAEFSMDSLEDEWRIIATQDMVLAAGPSEGDLIEVLMREDDSSPKYFYPGRVAEVQSRSQFTVTFSGLQSEKGAVVERRIDTSETVWRPHSKLPRGIYIEVLQEDKGEATKWSEARMTRPIAKQKNGYIIKYGPDKHEYELNTMLNPWRLLGEMSPGAAIELNGLSDNEN
eukprot:g5437.t1